MAPISTDHFPVLFSLSNEKANIRGKGFWKFNSCLNEDENYINEYENVICNFSTNNALREKCPFPELFCFAFYRIRTEYGEILRCY